MNELLPLIEEIHETEDFEEANKAISNGWILVGTYVKTEFLNTATDQHRVYCLGHIRNLTSKHES